MFDYEFYIKLNIAQKGFPWNGSSQGWVWDSRMSPSLNMLISKRL